MKKVLVFGTFDTLHKGHLDLFTQAKKLGDYLIVVVSPDKRLKAEKNREPRQPERDRVKAIRQSGLANEVILGEESGHYDLIDKIKPDIIAVGYDQIIPLGLKNRLKKYKIVRLKPFRPEIYKSSKLAPSSSG